MTPTYAGKNGRRYGYYVCSKAPQRGRSCCPSRALPQEAIDQWVLDRLGEVAREAEEPPPFAELARWPSLTAEERQRLLHAWVERVDYDGSQNKGTITFRSSSEKHPSKRSQGERA